MSRYLNEFRGIDTVKFVGGNAAYCVISRICSDATRVGIMTRVEAWKMTAAFAVAAAALPTGAIAKTPDKEVLTATSETALVVIKTDFWQPAPYLHSAFRLIISAFDPVESKLIGGPFSGAALFEAQKKKFADGYLLAPIKPGRWVFMSYSQQDKWALCFNAASVQFEVKPGEVVYLGEFDALSHRDQLTEQAVLSGKTRISGYGFADFFDLPTGPKLKPVDEAQLANVRAMLVRNAPLVTAPVRAVEYSPAKFGTGSTLFAERRCGGYFSKSAKKKDEAAK